MLKLDRIFIINLKHRTDRREHILSEMKKQNITTYEFFDAIRPTTEEVNDWNPTYCHHVIKHVSSNKFDNYFSIVLCFCSHFCAHCRACCDVCNIPSSWAMYISSAN